MRPRRIGHSSSGFVLIVVLGAILVLSALLFGFNQAARTDISVADGFYRTEQVRAAAWAGLNLAIATIRDTQDIQMDPRYAELLTGENEFIVDDANCSVTIAEENGLLNVNTLKTAEGQLDRRRIEQFLRLIDLLNHQPGDSARIGYGVVPCIIDWTDRDNEVTHLDFVKNEGLGAEEGYYQTCAPPYPCRNGPIETIDELVWIKGMTAESFNRLRGLLTCRGDGKININAAPKLVIESLSEQIDGALAQMVVNQRRVRPFRSPAELRNVPGMTDNIFRSIKDMVAVNPTERYYRVLSRASMSQRRCTIEALLRRNTQAGNVDIILYREL